MNRSVLIGIGSAMAVAAVAVVLLSGTDDSPAYVDSGSENKSAEKQNLELHQDKIRILASFYPYYEFARNIAGDRAVVKQYLPSGIEAHDWEPRAQEIQSLKSANVFVYNGLGIDPYVDRLMASGEFDDVSFVNVSKGIRLISLKDDGHKENGGPAPEYDPHIWLDPVLVKQQVTTIKDELVRADPENAQYYEMNSKSYNGKLDELDMKIKSALSSCKKNTFVPFHNAFAYLGERYGLEVMALSGVSPDSEATAAEVAAFVDFVMDNDIKVIFAESQIDPRLAEVIADEAGAKVLLLSPIEALTDEETENGMTYIGKMEQNLDALRVALECQ